MLVFPISLINTNLDQMVICNAIVFYFWIDMHALFPIPTLVLRGHVFPQYLDGDSRDYHTNHDALECTLIFRFLLRDEQLWTNDVAGTAVA